MAKTTHIAAISAINSTIPILLDGALQHADSGAEHNIQQSICQYTYKGSPRRGEFDGKETRAMVECQFVRGHAPFYAKLCGFTLDTRPEAVV